MPQRGRECQWRQPGSPMSSLETRTQRWRSGSAITRSSRPRLASSCGAAARELALGLAEADDERVADPLELGGAEHPRAADGADPPLDPLAGKRRGEELAQLDARGARSGGAARSRARRSDPVRAAPNERRGCGALTGARTPVSISLRSSGTVLLPPASGTSLHRAGSRRRSQIASSTAISGTPATPIAHKSVRSGPLADAAAVGGGPEQQPQRPLARRRSPASRCGSSPGRPSSASPSADGRIPGGRSTRSASNARSATRDSTIAIVSASSSRLRLTKPPCFIRSSTSASTGVGCSSGSSPMWR